MSATTDKNKLEKWLTDIKLGVKYKEKTSGCKHWKTYKDYYRGNYEDDENPLHNMVVINRVFSYIKSAIPRVYFRSPAINITARRPEFSGHARVVEALDNWLIPETGLKQTLKSAILDAFLCGIGIIKLGYDSEFGYNPEQVVDKNSGTVTQVGTKTADKVEYNTTIRPGMPWAARIKPEDFITPWGYDDPRDLPWCAQIVIRPLEDVKEDQKYDRAKTKDLKGGLTLPYDKVKTHSLWNHLAENNVYCLLYEITDYKRKRRVVICEDQILMDIEDPLQIDGLPYEFIIFNEDPDNFWPISDVKMLEPQQLELNEIRSYAKKQRRFNLIKFLFQKGTITPEQLDNLLSDNIEDTGCGIEIEGDSLQSAVLPLQPHNLTMDLIREQQQTDSDMREVMGFSENQAGSYVPKTNSTATEAEIVQEASSIRSDERRDIVADTLTNIVRKFNQFIFTYWDTEQVVEVAGVAGAKYWVKYTGPELRAEYTMIVSPESGQPVTRAMKQQMAQQLFTNFGQDPFIDPILLRRQLLRQTDLIDPEYEDMLRVPPEYAMMEAQKEMMLGMNQGQPITLAQLAQMPTVNQQIAAMMAQQQPQPAQQTSGSEA